MSGDSMTNDDTGSSSQVADVTGDFRAAELIEIVPLKDDTGGACKEVDNRDLSAEVKQETVAVVRDTDGPCTAECDGTYMSVVEVKSEIGLSSTECSSADWNDEVMKEILPVVNQELGLIPVCYSYCLVYLRLLQRNSGFHCIW